MPSPLVIHVSLSGNDRHDGRTPAAAVRSLARAQALIRGTRERGRTPIEVWLHGGTWTLATPLVFTARDGGAEGAPVTWRSAPGTRAVLSAGVPLSGWREDKINGVACWTAELPAVKRGWRFTQLFVDGGRRHWCRFPAEGFHTFAGLDGQTDTGFQWNKGPKRAEFKPGDINPEWHALGDVRILAYQLWFETHHRIAKIDRKRRIVHFLSPSLGSLIDETGKPARYAVFHVREALREPGTWYLDGRAGKLHYIPKPGEALRTAQVVAPKFDRVVEVAGTSRAPVRHLQFAHLSFQHAEFDRPAERTGAVQAAFDVPGAVRLRWAEECALYGCEIAHCGGYGVQVEAGCHRTTIAACRLHDLGAGGVRVDDEELRVHDKAVGSRQRLIRPEPQAATVIDCTIRDTGHRFPSSTGVFIANAGHCRVLHNEICDIPYTGVSVGWTWGYAPTRTVANRIEDNYIHHVNARRLLSDNGCIYTLGRHPGSTIRGNHIHDVDCYGYGGWGIYPDEGSSEFDIAENYVHNTRHLGLHMHYGCAVAVRNNVFAGSREGQFGITRCENHRSMTMQGNAIVAGTGAWAPAVRAPAVQLLWERNLLYDRRGGPFSAGELARLQAGGQHPEADLRDPGFVDAAGGDIRCFRNAPGQRLARTMRRARAAGARKLAALPESFDDYPLPPDRPYPVVETRLDLLREPAPAGDEAEALFKATWRNPGLVPARFSVRLVAPRGRIVGPTSVTATLKPGQEWVREVRVRAPAEALLVVLESRPVAGPAVPHLRFCRLVNGGRPYRLMAIPATKVENLAAALREAPAIRPTIGFDRLEGAEFRLGRMGDALVLHAEVEDLAITHGDTPWGGSCIELFAAPAAGAPTSCQVALKPACGDAGPVVFVANPPRPYAKDALPVRSAATPRGYTLSAIVPLARLGIAAKAKAIRFELVVTTTRLAGASAERACWCGTFMPHVRSDGMAEVVL